MIAAAWAMMIIRALFFDPRDRALDAAKGVSCLEVDVEACCIDRERTIERGGNLPIDWTDVDRDHRRLTHAQSRDNQNPRAVKDRIHFVEGNLDSWLRVDLNNALAGTV